MTDEPHPRQHLLSISSPFWQASYVDEGTRRKNKENNVKNPCFT